ncbi:hypothetical protein ACFZDJ_54860 [Streptomyces sp. NPDC007896]|uniref:hypothetical protein n=1 Tax=Streptomyces sp. NPDC007896 TaxID=3364784 RepID=UPI0036EC967D
MRVVPAGVPGEPYQAYLVEEFPPSTYLVAIWAVRSALAGTGGLELVVQPGTGPGSVTSPPPTAAQHPHDGVGRKKIGYDQLSDPLNSVTVVF